MKWLTMALALALALALGGATATAAERNIGVPADESWKHAETGLVLMPQLIGLPRTVLTDATRDERDVTVRFEAPDKSLSVTMYVFRPAIADVGLWFDSAQASLEAGQTFRNAKRATAEPVSFAAGTYRSASSLRQVYTAVGVPNRSIASAIVPVGQWLVSIELGSKVLTASQLEARLQEVINAVSWPGPTGVATVAASPVVACKTPLAFSARHAEQISSGGQNSIVASKDGARPVWCREGEAHRDYGVYRPDGDAAGYVILVNDSGGVVRVHPSAQAPGTQGGTYAVSLQDVDGNVSAFPSFTTLPMPGQVWALLGPASASAQ